MKGQFGASDGVHFDAKHSAQASHHAFTTRCGFKKDSNELSQIHHMDDLIIATLVL